MRINTDGSLTLESVDDLPVVIQSLIDFGNNTDPSSLGSPDKITLGGSVSGEGATLDSAKASLQSLYDNAPVGG